MRRTIKQKFIVTDPLLMIKRSMLVYFCVTNPFIWDNQSSLDHRNYPITEDHFTFQSRLSFARKKKKTLYQVAFLNVNTKLRYDHENCQSHYQVPLFI